MASPVVINHHFSLQVSGTPRVSCTTVSATTPQLIPVPVQVLPVAGTGFEGTGVVCRFRHRGWTRLFPTH